MRYRESRFERRLAERRAAAVEKSERQRTVEKFGPDAEERESDRRRNDAEESERILREMGIADRRRRQRRR